MYKLGNAEVLFGMGGSRKAPELQSQANPFERFSITS